LGSGFQPDIVKNSVEPLILCERTCTDLPEIDAVRSFQTVGHTVSPNTTTTPIKRMPTKNRMGQKVGQARTEVKGRRSGI
jgi:hypothetical protein